MVRTILGGALVVILGLLALRLVLGVVGGVLALAFTVAVFLIKVALAALLVYGVLLIVSPQTAKRVRSVVLGE